MDYGNKISYLFEVLYFIRVLEKNNPRLTIKNCFYRESSMFYVSTSVSNLFFLFIFQNIFILSDQLNRTHCQGSRM